MELLRSSIPKEDADRLWEQAREEGDRRRACPSCARLMREVVVPARVGLACAGACRACRFAWFDAGQYEGMVLEPGGSLSPEAREKLASLESRLLAGDVRARLSGPAPEEWWKWLPAMLGFPVEDHDYELRRRPVVTWVLTALLAFSGLSTIFSVRELAGALGLVPREAWRYGGLTFLTSAFLHADLFHLLSNLYFLFVFGDDVEDRLGRWRFGLLLVLAEIVGDLAEVFAAPASSIPRIGASVGISGVLCFYALQWPAARIWFFMPPNWVSRTVFGWTLDWISVPARRMLAIWVLLQVIGAWVGSFHPARLAFAGHLGGALVGGLFWLTVKDQPIRNTDASGDQPDKAG
ncbi:MAG: rhomboid family intramembrane serine protease [Candidatus Omnitrophica bacterium]|nr:rhomboid family intramembrane serine protease [Candidatus Omnitrophota bacterium]